MGLILLIILVLVLIGGFPAWPYSRSWGYGPSGLVGVLLLVLLVLLVMDIIPWGLHPVVMLSALQPFCKCPFSANSRSTSWRVV